MWNRAIYIWWALIYKMKNKRARKAKAVKASIECSTLSTSPNNSPSIQKKITKHVKQRKGGKHKQRRYLPKCTFIQFPNHNGIMQTHKLYKEDETCFAPKVYSEGIRDIYFDNDQTTDEDIIKETKKTALQSLSKALVDVLANPNCIKNYALQEQYSR